MLKCERLEKFSFSTHYLAYISSGRGSNDMYIILSQETHTGRNEELSNPIKGTLKG